jgi:3D (Asp-Asp-Asp) domain-containing protein
VRLSANSGPCGELRPAKTASYLGHGSKLQSALNDPTEIISPEACCGVLMISLARKLALCVLLVACGREAVRLDDPEKPDGTLNATDTQGSQAPSGQKQTSAEPVSPPEQQLSLTAAAQEFRLPTRTLSTPAERLWATFYHTLRFESAATGYDLLTLKGTPLGPKLTKLQWCQAAMEGSVQVSMDGIWKTYNYAGTAGSVQVDCSEFYDHPVGRTRFTVARGPYGDGVRNYILVPFRTIAVDPEVIPYGSVIFIPAARGLRFTLSDGTERIHDGYFFAGDTGGLIHGDHIDVFIGNALRSPFPWITSNSRSKTGYQIVPDSDLRDVLNSLHMLTSGK